MIMVILASSLLNLSAAPAADIPSKMLDNIYLDALTYTGYKTDVQKADGSIFKTYSGNAPASVRSGIGYGTGPSGLETVAADNKTGKAPDIAKFKANGLCCASYVSYVYYNYLPNIARMDVSKIPQPANPRSPISYNSAVENWVRSGGARRISFTQGTNSFTPSEEIPIGSLIIFKHKTTGEIAHLALYAGYYAGKHFVTHVGNERGPEISTVEGMSKGSYPEVVIRLSDKPEKGKISVLKRGEMFSSVTEEDGKYTPVYSEKGLKGAEFEVTAAEDIYTADGTLRIKAGETADRIISGEDGTAESKELYPGKYFLREISAPEGFVLDTEVKELTVTAGIKKIEVKNERKKQEFNLKKELETDQKFGIGFNGEIFNIRFGLFSKTELTALDGSIIPADGLIEVATPDEDGFICFAADMPYNAECYIKELESDEHYIISDKCYSDGDTAENKIIRGSIEGLKTDPSGRVLKGAVIGLFYPFETEFSLDTAIDTFETDEAGRFSFKDVPYGEWIIRELKAPDGYILSDENYTVTVKENGETVKLNIKNSKVPKPSSAPESPKTGDTANLLIPSAVLFTALAVIIFLSKKIKKEGYINE